MHLGNKLTSILVLALILGCLALVLLPESHRIPLPSAAENRAPDWFMENAHAMKTDEQGKITGIVTSPKLAHYQLNDVINMQQPFFTLFDKNNVPWHISALQGNVYQGKDERVELYNQVQVKQMPGQNSDNITLTTSQLTYYPNTSQAKTAAPVTIIEPGMSIQSVGFVADLKQGLIKFLSQSKLIYDEQNEQNPQTKH